MKADRQMCGPAEWYCTPCCSAGTPLMNARETLQTIGSMRNIGSSFLLRGFKLETFSKLPCESSVVLLFCLATVFANFEADLDCRCSCFHHVYNRNTQASFPCNFLSRKSLVCWKSCGLYATAVCSIPASDTNVPCQWQLHSANLACAAFPKLRLICPSFLQHSQLFFTAFMHTRCVCISHLHLILEYVAHLLTCVMLEPFALTSQARGTMCWMQRYPSDAQSRE